MSIGYRRHDPGRSRLGRPFPDPACGRFYRIVRKIAVHVLLDSESAADRSQAPKSEGASLLRTEICGDVHIRAEPECRQTSLGPFPPGRQTNLAPRKEVLRLRGEFGKVAWIEQRCPDTGRATPTSRSAVIAESAGKNLHQASIFLRVLEKARALRVPPLREPVHAIDRIRVVNRRSIIARSDS